MAELVDRYTYRVIWSEEDEEFVGLCAEFCLLSHLDDRPEKALTGIRDLVAHAVQLNQEEGIPVPEPLVTRRYSGTITLRIPPETHRALAIDAAEAGVSMNRLAAERLGLRR
jgi:predicted HicB family RNase H-like nuclease